MAESAQPNVDPRIEDGYTLDIDPNAKKVFFKDQEEFKKTDWKEHLFKPRVFCVVNLTASMIFDEDTSKAMRTSYMRTIDCLRKIAFYSRRKNGLTFTTYIGARKLSRAEIWNENIYREPKNIIPDMIHLDSLLDLIVNESKICPDDTIILFTDTGVTLTSTFKGFPCRTQVMFMDMIYDDKNKSDHDILVKQAEASIDELTKEARPKDFKPMIFGKCKTGEIIYRVTKDHLLKNPLKIFLGRIKQTTNLYPPCRFLPKGNIHIIGFMKSGSLANMPIFSKHILKEPGLVTISRKEVREVHKKKSKRRRKKKHIHALKKLQNPKNKRRTLGLLYMLKECLKKDELIALARYKTGQYCAIYSTKQDLEVEQTEEFGIALLDILQEFEFDFLVPYEFDGDISNLDAPPPDCHIVKRDRRPVRRHPFKIMSSWQSIFNLDKEGPFFQFDEDKENTQNRTEAMLRVHYQFLKKYDDKKKRELERLNYAPSYAQPTFKSWQVNETSKESQGMNNDFQKIFRLLKKVCDKPESVYLEVNKIRDYAVLVGINTTFLPVVAEFLRKQAYTMTESIQKHIYHICKHLQEPIPIAGKQIPIPILDEKKTSLRIIPVEKVERGNDYIEVPPPVPKEILFSVASPNDITFEKKKKQYFIPGGNYRITEEDEFHDHEARKLFLYGNTYGVKPKQPSKVPIIIRRNSDEAALPPYILVHPVELIKAVHQKSQMIPQITFYKNTSTNEEGEKTEKETTKPDKPAIYPAHFFHDGRDRNIVYDYDHDTEYRAQLPSSYLDTDFIIIKRGRCPSPEEEKKEEEDEEKSENIEEEYIPRRRLSSSFQRQTPNTQAPQDTTPHYVPKSNHHTLKFAIELEKIGTHYLPCPGGIPIQGHPDLEIHGLKIPNTNVPINAYPNAGVQVHNLPNEESFNDEVSLVENPTTNVPVHERQNQNMGMHGYPNQNMGMPQSHGFQHPGGPPSHGYNQNQPASQHTVLADVDLRTQVLRPEYQTPEKQQPGMPANVQPPIRPVPPVPYVEVQRPIEQPSPEPPVDRDYREERRNDDNRRYEDRRYEDRRYEDRRYEDRRYEDRRYEDRRNDDRRYENRRDHEYENRDYDRRHFDERENRRDDYDRGRDRERDRDRDRGRDRDRDRGRDDRRRRYENHRVDSYKNGTAAIYNRDQRPNVYGTVNREERDDRRDDDERNRHRR